MNAITDLTEYWKNDFTCLQDAGGEVNQYLRQDEQPPPVFQEYNDVNNSNDDEDAFFQLKQRMPLHKTLITATPKLFSKMGLWTELSCVYKICDSTLYLWNYTTQTVLQYTTTDSTFTAAGIVVPKPGLFDGVIESAPSHFVVVADYNQVQLLALTTTELKPLKYKATVEESEIIVSIVGTPDGRIFLGGRNGAIIEFPYTVHRDPTEAFYNGTAPTIQLKEHNESSQWGKRMAQFLFLSDDSSPVPMRGRKCRRVDRSAANEFGRKFVPEFFLSAPAYLFGTKQHVLKELLLKENLIFSLCHDGHVAVHNLTTNKNLSSLNVPERIKRHIERVSRNVVTGKKAMAAGGMDGARRILRIANQSPEILVPVRLSNVEGMLVAVTKGGLRAFLEFKGTDLTLIMVRAPPTRLVDLGTSCVDDALCEDRTLVAAWRESRTTVGQSTILSTTQDLRLATTVPGKDPIHRERALVEDAKIPGGKVWQIAKVHKSKDQTLLNLLNHSATPTDAELNVQLPPPYLPPSKERDSITTAIVKRPTPNSPSLSDQFVRVTCNFLLSKPILQGVSSPSHGEAERRRVEQEKQRPDYRISQHDASKGFSSTAAELRQAFKSTTETQSARLRPWLLQPSSVALSPLAKQLYQNSEDVLVVNDRALYFLGFNTVLSSLIDLLVTENEAKIDRFFEGYGYKEGCCLCLAVSVGCGDNPHEKIRERAALAAMRRGFQPKLVLKRDTPIVEKPFVPAGYEFQPSHLYCGLTSLLSRLVRPIWHKPAVVVTEGPSFKRSGESKASQCPAKVELLLDDAVLTRISSYLYKLQILMKDRLAIAVRTVPGVAQRRYDSMDIEDTEEDRQLTRTLQMRAMSGGTTTELSPVDGERIAQLLEEKNIHSLYRLLARVVQLITVMSKLKQTRHTRGLREVEWGLLHGLTVSQLVLTANGQERLESLLNSLVTVSAAGSAASGEANQLAGIFADSCYLFFSPGSRSAYLGLRSASEARRVQKNTARFVSLRNEAANHLLEAAKHWHSTPLITGRVLHSGDKESYSQIAKRAKQFGSPLAIAAEALAALDAVSNLVQVCLVTAANFKNGQPSSSFGSFAAPQRVDLSWEKNLYHKRQEVTTNTNTMSPGLRPTSQIVPHGAEVTPKDAVRTCFSLVFHHLSLIMQSNPALADHMVSACTFSKDEQFLQALFEFMFESNYKSTLLRIEDCEALDKWLLERNEPDLLFRYYTGHDRFREAGAVALKQAKDANSRLALQERIGWLVQAETSFSGKNAPEASDAKSSLGVARIQKRLLDAIDSTKLQPDQLEKLNSTLMTATDLFNEVAVEHDMYDCALLIFRACNVNDPNTIQPLWKRIICSELLPVGSADERIVGGLREFVTEVGLEHEVKALNDTVGGLDSIQRFENGGWEAGLRQKVVEVGQELYEEGAEYIFPVDYILRCLEGMCFNVCASLLFPLFIAYPFVPFAELRQLAPQLLAPAWSLQVLTDAGISHMAVLNAYEGSAIPNETLLLGGPDGAPTDNNDKVRAMVGLLGHWVSKAGSRMATGTQDNKALAELQQERASGQLRLKILAIETYLSEMAPYPGSLLTDLKRIQREIQEIDHMLIN